MKDWEAVNQGMQLVIYGTDPFSTGAGVRLGDGFPFRIAGKSGTAERFSRTTDAYNENKNTAYLAARHRAWFEAYTPADDPKIAVVSFLEAGAWGAKDAGPIARKVLDAWLITQGGAVPPDKPLPEPLPPTPVVPTEDAPALDSTASMPSAPSSADPASDSSSTDSGAMP
jgi:penicillin-binding protein 2